MLFGAIGDDEFSGGEGNDELAGGAGDDRVRGQNGDDVISCGDGNDMGRLKSCAQIHYGLGQLLVVLALTPSD